ncbi:MAG: hypothetical protein ABFD18_20005 [Syntrophomonas sp.]
MTFRKMFYIVNGGGFAVLNGIGFNDEDGSIREYDSPYLGSNIFSLASSGAIYVRDPQKKLVEEQLNGGEFNEISDVDWDLILARPLLRNGGRLPRCARNHTIQYCRPDARRVIASATKQSCSF